MAKGRPPSDPAHLLSLLHARNDRESAQSLRHYLDRCLVDIVPEPRPFAEVIEPWQAERNERLIPAFEFIAGLRPDYSGPRSFWEGYSKGSDKTGTIARLTNWLLGYSKKALRVCAAAKDAEQAGELLDSMVKQADLNPWLRGRLDFKRNWVEGKTNGAKLQILTSDAGGIQGKTPDAIIADELTHWAGQEMWDSLYGGAMKRSGKDASGRSISYCVTVIITNAGYLGSWQHDLRRIAQSEHGRGWSFYEQPQGTVLASWLSLEVMEQIRRGMTPFEARRLLDNEWIDPSEAGVRLFSPEDVDRCIGFPQPPPPGAQVYLGIDYGGTCDPAALAVLWCDPSTGVVTVNEVTCYQGSPGNEVQVDDIEQWVEYKLARFPDATCVFDKHQLLGTIQDLERRGVSVKRFEYRGGKNNALMARNLRDLMSNRKMVFAVDCGLIGGTTLATELKRVIGREMNYGQRIDHKSGEHDDRVVAVGMASLEAVMNTLPGPVPQRNEQLPYPAEFCRPRPPLFGGPLSGRTHTQRRGLFGLSQDR